MINSPVRVLKKMPGAYIKIHMIIYCLNFGSAIDKLLTFDKLKTRGFLKKCYF